MPRLEAITCRKFTIIGQFLTPIFPLVSNFGTSHCRKCKLEAKPCRKCKVASGCTQAFSSSRDRNQPGCRLFRATRTDDGRPLGLRKATLRAVVFCVWIDKQDCRTLRPYENTHPLFCLCRCFDVGVFSAGEQIARAQEALDGPNAYLRTSCLRTSWANRNSRGRSADDQ